MNLELLAPAGSYESLTAALNAGADAVYIGGSRFGARAYAKNPDEKLLLTSMDECHLRGKKLYLTINTLLKERELGELYDYLLPYYERGLDAAIVQDLGVLSFLKQEFPELSVHASTQMSVTGCDSVRLLMGLGVTRVVTARELSLKEISHIYRETGIEIESFVHGALCYSYSGQCLLSSMIGGRSGNRGRCAQPCRLPYLLYEKEQKKSQEAFPYLLSPKDLCALPILPELAAAGIHSFKIEGRMKNPAYTAGVVRIYRKYLELFQQQGAEKYHVEQDDMRELMDLYNRGGFSKGYYHTRNGREMMSPERPNHAGTKAASIISMRGQDLLLKAAEPLNAGDVLEILGKRQDQKGYEFTLKNPVDTGMEFKVNTLAKMKYGADTQVNRTRNSTLQKELSRFLENQNFQEKINGKLILSKGHPAILEVKSGTFSAVALGMAVSEAISQPLNLEKAEKQIRKTGNTPFMFEELKLEMDEDTFLPVQALNDLRREALKNLENTILSSFSRKAPCNSAETKGIEDAAVKDTLQNMTAGRIALTVLLENMDGFSELLNIEEISAIYLDCLALQEQDAFLKSGSYINQCHAVGKKCFYRMPHIFRKDTKDYYQKSEFKKILELFDGICVRNLEELAFVKSLLNNKILIADHSLYTFNSFARKCLNTMGVTTDTAPLEENSRELERRGCTESELVVYGHAPLMVSAQCLKKTLSACDRQTRLFSMEDRKGKRMPVRTNCRFCYNTIYNGTPLVLLDNASEVLTLHPGSVRLEFTVESKSEIICIARKFADVYGKGKSAEWNAGDFTRGHFKRGVE